MKIKKKQIVIIGAAVAVIAVAGVIFAVAGKGGGKKGDPESTVYVDSVAELCGLGSGNGLNDRFSGVVEPQKTWDIQVASDKTVDEILVEEGEEVKVGDELFTYNTEEMEEKLAQAEIDLDRLANEIDQTKAQIESLKKEKASAGADEQLSYTTQINTAENDIKRKEYEQKSKKMEIEKLKDSMANATVTSEMDGLVKSINSGDYKENTNASMEDHFFFGRRTDYWMVSRSRSKYIALFKEIGFQILEEQVIYHREEQIGSTQKELETFMCILKKG